VDSPENTQESRRSVLHNQSQCKFDDNDDADDDDDDSDDSVGDRSVAVVLQER
jgi:hypothetical protein